MTKTIETAAEAQSIIKRFIEKAGLASAVVHEISDPGEAVAYTLDLCGNRGACRIKVAGCEEHLSAEAEGLCEAKEQKIIAAPDLDPELYDHLERQCVDSGFTCLRSGMRSQLAGVDIGLTYADLGIAETGTVVLNCPSEELRLATMICEYHICILRKSRIFGDSLAATEQLFDYMSNTPNYTAFITGPSRTADIERVLAIGVHGPLELHILLLED